MSDDAVVTWLERIDSRLDSGLRECKEGISKVQDNLHHTSERLSSEIRTLRSEGMNRMDQMQQAQTRDHDQIRERMASLESATDSKFKDLEIWKVRTETRLPTIAVKAESTDTSNWRVQAAVALKTPWPWISAVAVLCTVAVFVAIIAPTAYVDIGAAIVDFLTPDRLDANKEGLGDPVQLTRP